MPKSTYLSNAQLNHGFRTASWVKVGTLYLGLFFADPTDAVTLANELTIGVGGYARAAVTVGDAQWTAPATSGSAQVITNVSAINFGTATATLNGGVAIPYWAILDAATAGNGWYHGPISLPRVIQSGDPITVAAGAITISEE